MAEVTQAEIKDAIRIAGDMEKALYAFRDLTKFLAIYGKALSDEEKAGPRRAQLERDIDALGQRALSAKKLVDELAGEVAEARLARAQREADAEKLCADRVAAYKRQGDDAQAAFEDKRKELGAQIQSLNEELSQKRTELVSIKAELDLLKKRLG